MNIVDFIIIYTGDCPRLLLILQLFTLIIVRLLEIIVELFSGRTLYMFLHIILRHKENRLVSSVEQDIQFFLTHLWTVAFKKKGEKNNQ